jgi:hypothetical protein
MDKIFEIKKEMYLEISYSDWRNIGKAMKWSQGRIIEDNPKLNTYVAELVGHTSGLFADENGQTIHQKIYEPDI